MTVGNGQTVKFLQQQQQHGSMHSMQDVGDEANEAADLEVAADLVEPSGPEEEAADQPSELPERHPPSPFASARVLLRRSAVTGGSMFSHSSFMTAPLPSVVYVPRYTSATPEVHSVTAHLFGRWDEAGGGSGGP